MDRETRQRILVWGLSALAVVIVFCLFAFVSTGVGMAVVGLAIAAGVVIFAGWRRLILIGVVLVLVTFFTSVLIRLSPTDPTVALIPFSSEEQRAELREELGLNENVFVQYKDFMGDFVTGETNYYQSSGRAVNGTPVWDRLGDALPVSIQLMLYAQILALAFAIPLGIAAAYRSGTRTDKALSTTAFGLLSLPNFVLAFILIYYLAVQNDFFPTSGLPADAHTPFDGNAADHFRSMFLPAVSLGAAQIAIYMRLLRSDMIQTLQEDFITMARSKGLSTRRILLRHALRPSSFTLLTAAAINIGALIGGAIVIEVIFQLPGVGLLIFQAINEKQYVALQTFVGIIAIAYVLANVVVDLLYSVLDPRIRHARAA
ncbi:MAG: ABC transporter permease [Acidimicrobiia bacterium]